MDRPIGIFDSGVGGLTVLDALRKSMPEENFVYLGDTANVPYGTKSPEEIKKLAVDAYKRLLNYDIKALIIGCNTATVHGLDAIRELADIPVIGIIEAGVQATIDTDLDRVLLVATDATVNSGYYQRDLKGLKDNLLIQGKGCPKWVIAVEEGIMGTDESLEIVSEILDKSIINEEVVLLGCTHFPALRDDIEKYYRSNNKDVTIINPAIKCAEITEDILIDKNIKNKSKEQGEIRYFSTGDPEPFRQSGSKVLGTDIDKDWVQQID